MSKIVRRKTPSVQIGGVLLGSAHPIVVQSMTDTPTADQSATLEQTLELIEAGSQMVRWTINDDAAAESAISMIKHLRAHNVKTPIIGDFHFNGHLLLSKDEELAALLDKYRINPGNTGRGLRKDENFATIIRMAIKYKKAVRIGVNWGSLDKDILSAVMDDNSKLPVPKSIKEVMYQAMVESALESCHYALELGLSDEKLVLSAKLSVVQDTIEVYERLARACGYVLHLGLTEAGGGIKGVASSAAALSVLLQQGIGDTMRVSLTPEPGVSRTREVEVCQEILQSMGFRYFIPSVVSCPGCGRTKSVYFQNLAKEIREYISFRMKDWRERYPGVEVLKIAVMGCVVNGPGESMHADIGISLPGSSEDPSAPVFIDGKKCAVLKGDAIKDDFIRMLEDYVKERFSKVSKP